jgi:hypothetical protein
MRGLRLAEALRGEPEIVHGAPMALAYEGLSSVEGIPARIEAGAGGPEERKLK